MIKKGFTLAEVLVTLGIIGVVSAMTIPTLVRNHQKIVFVNQLRKVVSLLSQAADSAIQEENVINLDESKFANSANNVDKFFKKYLKIATDCGRSYTPCFAENYKNREGSVVRNYHYAPNTVITLADGTSIASFEYWARHAAGNDQAASEAKKKNRHGYLRIMVDLNGQQGPNIIGRDLFYMELYSDGKVAEAYNMSGEGALGINGFKEKCIHNGQWDYLGTGCLTHIMADGWKMDY